MFQAEDSIGLTMTPCEAKLGNISLEFREVFKWVMSPIIAERLQSKVNLDSKFFINCSFSEKTNIES